MNVYELQERILELSHDEVTHETGLRARSLRWLNSAYHELMEVMMPLLSDSLSLDVTVPVVAGEAALSGKSQKILRVERADTGAVVPYKSAKDVSINETVLTYRTSVNGIVLSGQNVPEAVRIVYVPQVSDLLEDDTEESILIPAQYHTALVWGALVWASVFERGFTSQRELSLYQGKWEEAKRNAKLSLASRTGDSLKVAAFDII